MDVLLTSTDTGVVVQLTVWIAVSLVALWLTLNPQDMRLVTIGVSLVGSGVMGVRAIH